VEKIQKWFVVTLMVLIVAVVTPNFSGAAGRADPSQESISSKALSQQHLTSVYTDFAKCRTLQEPTDTNLTLLRRCPGVAGFKLLLQWDDDALTATMVTPKGRKFDLGINELFTQSKPYADLKAKAEWRVKRERGIVVPVALILRVEPMNDMSTNDRPFLAVAKITKDAICMTDKIATGAKENEAARQAADIASTKPCLKQAD
jgi:hypothetical protein